MSSVQGTCADAFLAVKHALEANIANGDETGGAIFVNLDGRTVVDIWGGFADSQRSKPWTEHTIVNVWSVTKNVTSLAALMLVDRGLLDLDAPVSQYWPEFGANGKKDKVLVRHLLSHMSGVSGWDRAKGFNYTSIYDLEKSTARLAQQAPWWEPGTAAGYHAINYGHLVGEIVRRVSGKSSLHEFVADEIARPIKADFQLGARAEDWHRVAEIIPPPPPSIDRSAIDREGIMYKTMSISSGNFATAPNTSEYRRAEIGAVNGFTNARALGRIFSTLTAGGSNEGEQRSFLSQKTIDKILDVQYEGPDLVIMVPLRWGVGFGLPYPGITPPCVPLDGVFFWTGWGGSVVVVDLERKLTIAYTMNKMGSGIVGSDRTWQYVTAIYEAVREPRQKL